jgi:hypothetical protein
MTHHARTSTRRRRIIKVCVLLLLTFATALVVWALSQTRWLETSSTRDFVSPARWFRPVPESWPEPLYSRVSHDPLRTHSYSSERIESDYGIIMKRRWQLVEQCGWPFRMFEMVETADNYVLRDVRALEVDSHSYGGWTSPWWLARCLGYDWRLSLAVAPMPLGLTLNVLIYFVFWSGVLHVAGRVRRLFRRRRDALPCCHSCGYDRTGIPADSPCPECGTTSSSPC